MNTKNKKKSISIKSILRPAVFFLLVFVIYKFLEDELSNIIEEIQMTRISLIFVIACLGLIFYLVEASNYYILSRSYKSNLSWFNSLKSSLMSAFYRLISFGFGGGVSTIYYLNDYSDMNVGMSSSIFIFQYMTYKASVSLFALLAFLLNMSKINSNYGVLYKYILIGLGVNLLIILFLLLITVSKRSHQAVIKLSRKFIKKEDTLKKIEDNLYQLSHAYETFSKEKSSLAKIFLLNFIRLLSLYSIPYILMIDLGLDYFYALSLMAIIIAIAGVIPSPSGIGSIELLFISIFQPLVGKVAAASAILLYRFAYFIFPGIVGGLIVFITRIILDDTDKI